MLCAFVGAQCVARASRAVVHRHARTSAIAVTFLASVWCSTVVDSRNVTKAACQLACVWDVHVEHMVKHQLCNRVAHRVLLPRPYTGYYYYVYCVLFMLDCSFILLLSDFSTCHTWHSTLPIKQELTHNTATFDLSKLLTNLACSTLSLYLL